MNQPPIKLPKWKIALFSCVVTFVLLGLILVLLEFSMARAGSGVATSFYLKSVHEGEQVSLSNQYFMRQYFGAGISRGSMPFRIPEDKPENSVRIFLLGASAAQGDPAPEYGMGRQLEIMLEEQFPDQSIEVYNVAITAINSHVVLPIMRACLDLDPDLFIMYLGNNEVVGPYGAGSVFSPLVKYRWLIALQTKVRASRYGQWISSNLKKDEGKPTEWGGMEMFLDNPVPQNDSRMQTVYLHYKNNLRAMFKTGSQHGVPVLISTVAVNLKDNAPFGSQHNAALSEDELKTWESQYSEGNEKLESGQVDQALEIYKELLKLDDQYAELHFRIAECYLKNNQIDLAKQAYEMARDLDVLRFRADSTINKIIQETAADFEAVTLVDGRKVIEEHSPNGIPGTEVLYEHVHFNFTGNYLLAKSFNPAVVEKLEAERGIKPESNEVIPEAEVKKRLAYTHWDQLKIARFNLERLETPPFTFQSDIEKQKGKLVKEVDALSSGLTNQVSQDVLAEYEYALKNYPHWFIYDNFADLHVYATGNLPIAEEYYQKVIDEYPHDTRWLDSLGLIKIYTGKYKEAEKLFRASLEAEPNIIEKKVNLGVVIGMQGRHEEAINLLSEVTAVTGYHEQAYFNLGLNHFNQNTSDPENQREALKYWQVVIENNPDYTDARFGVANIYARQGKTSQAIQGLKAVLAKDPNHQRSRALLEQLTNNLK
ncbi:MAG: tetratricopeptide repeat protein [Opitutales bacterium]|nr:tetratricopeptide repeat protein [Opitutales bacterium]